MEGRGGEISIVPGTDKGKRKGPLRGKGKGPLKGKGMELPIAVGGAMCSSGSDSETGHHGGGWGRSRRDGHGSWL